ncbi:tape measure protein [Peptostreptococcus faecalis]|uniref:tape measure protein n=1 Tax=Peptostreptococcus faecalis TaxID=2045015 RepID=UPI000C7CB713|nr:tape measure protein [Peptostreptococcus faecalis]
MAGISAPITIQDRASGVLGYITRASELATGSIKGLASAVNSDINMNRIMGVSGGIGEVDTNIQRATNSQRQLNNEMNNGSQGMNKLVDGAKRLAGVYLSLQGIKKAVSAGDEVSNTIARMNLMENKTGTGKDLFMKTYQAANRARTSVTDLSGSVSKLGLLAGDKFTNDNEIVSFAESLSKSFALSGTDTQGKAAAMHQITQAMASGRLQGDEFLSVLENAPMFANAIKEELNGIDMKKASSEGLITFDVMKRAAESMKNDVNSMLGDMPFTFANHMEKLKDNALIGFMPLFEALSRLWNNPYIVGFVENSVIAFSILGQVAGGVIDFINMGVTFLGNNMWLLIPPLVLLASHLAITGALALWNLGISIAKAAANIAETVAIYGLIIAQNGLNAAILACPIAWIIAGIVLVIYGVIKLIQWLSDLAGHSMTTVGTIGAIFGFLATFLINVVGTIWNNFASLIEFLVNVWKHPKKAIQNFALNIAKNFLGLARSVTSSCDGIATNIANAFISGANMAIKAVNWIIDALNHIPGINLGKMGEIGKVTSITSSIASAEKGLENMIKDNTPDDYWTAPKFKATNLLDGAKAGEQFANGLMDKAKGMFNLDAKKDKNGLNDLLKQQQSPLGGAGGTGGKGGGAGKNPLKGIEENTKRTADNTENSRLDVRYLREIAERQSINRFTTATIQVENNITSTDPTRNIDGIVDAITERITEDLNIQADGVY